MGRSAAVSTGCPVGSAGLGALASVVGAARRPHLAQAGVVSVHQQHAASRMDVALNLIGRTFQRKAKDKRSSLSRLAEEINFTIVQLHDPEGHGQSDSRPFLLGGKIELENLVSFFGWDSR